MRLRHALCFIAGLAVAHTAAAQEKRPPQPSPDTISIAKDTSGIEEVKENALDNIPVVSLDENEIADGSAQNISSVLTAGRDPYFSGASFHFNAARFRIRGYDADLFATYMNGVPMENLDNGFTPWGLWGGLNDVMRNRELTIGLRPSTFAFGEIGGATLIDARASRQRRQSSFNYAISNRNYRHRWMGTYSTGQQKNGWAFTLSGSRRWADEGYVPGTFYDGWSYFISIDKKINNRHSLSLTAFGAPTKNGRQNASIQEMYNLAGTNFYNPTWGYQNGKKRNASVGNAHIPFIILTHDFKISERTTLTTAAAYSFGKRSTTALDWYNAPDPRPDYYRYLPSYFEAANPGTAADIADVLRNNENARQINWERLYDANTVNIETINNVNGIAGNNVTGRRSVYIVEERIINTSRANFNTILNTNITDNISFSGGLTYQAQKNSYYKEVNDLLGGDFYVDLNQFAERDFPGNNDVVQNDLNRPNRTLKKGDRFGYDYDFTIRKATAWAQAQFKYRKADFFLSGEISNTRFWRTGKLRNGLFPNNSFGKSEVNNFTNYAVKAGATYKIDGRNYLYVNGTYLTRAPFFENVYVAPRNRDLRQQDITPETIYGAEGGYILNAPKIKARISGYYTQFNDQMNVITFYHDELRTFVNYGLTNIDKMHAGVEIGVEAKLYQGLSANAAANIGRYYFNSRQNATITQDNNASVLDKEVIFSENFRVATPQEAYTVGLSYRAKQFWFLNLNVNYFDQMWLDFNPVRRTYKAVDDIDFHSDKWYEVINQTRLQSQTTVDLFGGKSWRIRNGSKNLFLFLNVGVNNLLNNKKLISGGFEQMRFDFQTNNVNKFPPRLFYSYGVNYFASIGIRM